MVSVDDGQFTLTYLISKLWLALIDGFALVPPIGCYLNNPRKQKNPIPHNHVEKGFSSSCHSDLMNGLFV